VIVVDASAALSALLNAGPARAALAAEQLHAPHLIDVEVAHGLRRRVAAKSMTGAQGWTALDAWRRLGMTRYPTVSLLDGAPAAPCSGRGTEPRLATEACELADVDLNVR